MISILTLIHTASAAAMHIRKGCLSISSPVCYPLQRVRHMKQFVNSYFSEQIMTKLDPGSDDNIPKAPVKLPESLPESADQPSALCSTELLAASFQLRRRESQ